MKYEQLNLDVGGIIFDDVIASKKHYSLGEKIEESIKALKLATEMSFAYYGQPLVLAYSGGKDSDVLLHLAKSCLNNTDFEVINGHTTVDAPETVYHIRETFKRLNEKGIRTTIDYHKNPDGTNKTMWNLIPKKSLPPTRILRYCCQELKETTTPNRLCALGVRAAESSIRQGRDTFSTRGGVQRKTHFTFRWSTLWRYTKSRRILKTMHGIVRS